MEDRWLFRAKRVDNGEWIQGYLFRLSEKLPPFIMLRSGKTASYEVDLKTVCQCTGLNDKNGNLIWENDIVYCTQYVGGNYVDYCTENGYVEMLHGAFGLHRKQGYYRPFKDWLEDYEYEVFGNTFDNPELLETGDKT